MTAMWNGEVVAESDDTVVVEGNHHDPRDAVRSDVPRLSSSSTTCAGHSAKTVRDHFPRAERR